MGIENRLKKIIIAISNSYIKPKEITNETSLISDLNFDSVKILEVIINVESEFMIEIEDSDLDLETIAIFGSLLQMIRIKL